MRLSVRARVIFGVLIYATCVGANLADGIIGALENAFDCVTCHALLAPVKFLAFFGDAVFSRAWIVMCQIVGAADPDVCEGLISQQGPILAHDLRSISIGGQTATKLCDVVFGLCKPPPVNPYIVQFPRATPENLTVFKSMGRKPFQVAHFSDAHIDRQYTPGSDSKCTKPICCRNYAGHDGPIVQPAGPFGSFNCDAPANLAESMLRAIPTSVQFSIFTGDVINAAVWLLDQTGVTSDLESFNREMATILNSPVYPVIGNHEATPVNAFPRSSTSSASSQWIFDTQSRGWSQWLHADALDQVTHMSGSYSVIAEGTNLRIISLNNIYWYKDNFWLYDSDNLQPDPNELLNFVVRELQAAEDAGQRAWIIAHMPPGRGDVLRDQSNYYDQIIQRYRNTIAAQFYGHTHLDQFAVAYSDYYDKTAETAVSVGLIAPSLTPRNGNPAFKVYDVDPDTYEIMDARVYISNLTDPSFQQNPTWKLYYSARDTYGPLVGLSESESLGPAFWHRVTEAFAANDTAFQSYVTFMTRGVDVKPCNSTCKSITICEMRTMRSENSCDEDQFLRKTGLDFAHAEHCEGLNIGHLFRNIRNLVRTMYIYNQYLSRTDGWYG
ncbi:hypothetical protein AX15_004402 [Amanita polypyramis BW_CC]|nr:hypothetical protein AX15_004402 [Amanita polypyramis BW_CC]